MMKAALAIGLALLGACATGGAASSDANGKPADATVHQDGHNVAPGDAISQPHDASVSHPLDAFVPQDASDQGGGFCNDNTDCPGVGTCCFVAVCVPGTAVGTTLCFPS